MPFADSSFDLLYNAYMLDIIRNEETPLVLGEFSRVLRPGGRLVLLNMSKKPEKRDFRERIYQLAPANLVLYLGGGRRPVLMEKYVQEAGFP